MSANGCTFAFCCVKYMYFALGKGKMAVNEVFRLTNTAKLRWYRLCFRLFQCIIAKKYGEIQCCTKFYFMASFEKSQWYVFI